MLNSPARHDYTARAMNLMAGSLRRAGCGTIADVLARDAKVHERHAETAAALLAAEEEHDRRAHIETVRDTMLTRAVDPDAVPPPEPLAVEVEACPVCGREVPILGPTHGRNVGLPNEYWPCKPGPAVILGNGDFTTELC